VDEAKKLETEVIRLHNTIRNAHMALLSGAYEEAKRYLLTALREAGYYIPANAAKIKECTTPGICSYPGCEKNSIWKLNGRNFCWDHAGEAQRLSTIGGEAPPPTIGGP